VLAAWHAMRGLDLVDGGAKLASGAIAVAAALVVILIHHLGYRQFRARSSRPMLVGALVACGLQALAFLVTGNVLAPVVAHILLHAQFTFRAAEMPPAAAPPVASFREPITAERAGDTRVTSTS
jgi:hypothetical protein